MKSVASSAAGSRTLVLSVIAAAIWAIAGCGFSYNSSALKNTGESAVPVISCSASPATVVSGNSAQISTKASSPLGLPLTYSYSATAGTVASDGTSATLDTQGAAGSVTVTCKVVDAMGNAASSATTVAVEAAGSQPPTVSCSANPAAVTLGGSVAITAVASSPENRPLTYSWSASSGTIAGNGNKATLNTAGATAGTITVTCKAADNQGLTASAKTIVTVNASPVSAPPTISCSANPAAVTLGGSVTVTAVASSPEGRPLTYSWSASSGTIAGAGNVATLNTTGAAAATITVTCKVADNQGLTASAKTSVTVNAAPVSPPPAISCSANPAAVTLGGSVTVTAVASSPEGRPLTYSWSASSGTISGAGNVATLNTSGAAVGAITVTCKAADNQGLTASAKTTVTVNAASVSAPPAIRCSANPAAVTLGGSVTVTAVASSPEGRPLTYSWSASSGTISGTGNVATLHTSGAAAGTITVTCKAGDNQGLTASAKTTVTVNAAPVSAPPAISCSANPAAVTVGGSVTVTVVASSPEGRPLTYSWSASSGTIAGNGNTATLNTSGAAAGAITVTCKVADDQGRSASATTAVTVNAVQAAPPTISCSANPSIINQGGTAVITAAGSSPQNLPLTYSYSASAGSISGTGTTANLETSGASAGVVTVTCTVDQQGGGTASATANVILQSVTGEQALTNFQFTDSVGVNVHLAYGNTVYGSQFPQIMQSMISLGVTHYRDGLNQYAPNFQYQNAEMLGKAGIKADWIMDFNNSASIISSAYANAPDATEEFEGSNEDDAEAGAPLLAFMQLLSDTVRGNPATAAMPIIAPSFVQPSSYAAQGDLSSLINFGNTHDYFGNRNPETAPYGGSFYNCGGYGSMQFDMCLAQMVGVNEPVVSTETGYASGAGLSDAIIGRYELRTLFESLRLGMARTFLYELIDEVSSLNYGLLTGSFSPRPAYTAIQNTLSLLKDANFAQPGKLDYTLTGQTQNVHHLLLQKSDGTFYMAIWLAVQDADPDNPSTTYTVAPQDVTLSANTPIGGATAYVLDDSGNMTSSLTQVTSGSLSISVTDRITLVALSPGESH